MSDWSFKHFAKKNTSSSKEQITRTPAISMIFACMVGKSRESPRFCILFIMLDGDFKRLFILSIGLRSCCNENSSFRISNLLSSAFSAHRYCSMTSWYLRFSLKRRWHCRSSKPLSAATVKPNRFSLIPSPFRRDRRSALSAALVLRPDKNCIRRRDGNSWNHTASKADRPDNCEAQSGNSHR